MDFGIPRGPRTSSLRIPRDDRISFSYLWVSFFSGDKLLLFLSVLSNLCVYPSSVQGTQQRLTWISGSQIWTLRWLTWLWPVEWYHVYHKYICGGRDRPCSRRDSWVTMHPNVCVTKLTFSSMFLAKNILPRVEFPIRLPSTRQSYLSFPLLQKETQNQ